MDFDGDDFCNSSLIGVIFGVLLNGEISFICDLCELCDLDLILEGSYICGLISSGYGSSIC